MSEQSPSTPFESFVVPTPEELSEFGVRLEQAVAAHQPEGGVEGTRNELKEDYEAASADHAKKRAEIVAAQASINEVQEEIVDIIDSMSNDDAMIPEDEPSAAEMIRTRTDILYGRLRKSKQKKAHLVQTIKILQQEMDAISAYKDRNRQAEQHLVDRGVTLRQELSRLALVMSAIGNLGELKPTLPRYADRYHYFPAESDNGLDDFINIGAEPGERYTTVSLPVPFVVPVMAADELAVVPQEAPIRPVLPPVQISPKTQKKFLKPITNMNRR
jgi:hypothetical protein